MEMQQMDAAGGRSSVIAGQGQAISQEQINQMKEYYGFDKPWYTSYFIWLGKVVRGDLGSSYRYNEPVWDIIKTRFPISIFYGLLTLVATYSICIPLGITKAIRHRTFFDNSTSILIFAGYRIKLSRRRIA